MERELGIQAVFSSLPDFARRSGAVQPMVKAIPIQEDYTPDKLAGKIEGLMKAADASEVRPVKVAAWMPSPAHIPLPQI